MSTVNVMLISLDLQMLMNAKFQVSSIVLVAPNVKTSPEVTPAYVQKDMNRQ